MPDNKCETPAWATDRAVHIFAAMAHMTLPDMQEYLALQLAVAEGDGFRRGLDAAHAAVRKVFGNRATENEPCAPAAH